MVRFRFYCGNVQRNGLPVGPDHADKARKVLLTAFPGLTEYQTKGWWTDSECGLLAAEPSTVFEVLADHDNPHLLAQGLADGLAVSLNQTEVLVTVETVACYSRRHPLAR